MHFVFYWVAFEIETTLQIYITPVFLLPTLNLNKRSDNSNGCSSENTVRWVWLPKITIFLHFYSLYSLCSCLHSCNCFISYQPHSLQMWNLEILHSTSHWLEIKVPLNYSKSFIIPRVERCEKVRLRRVRESQEGDDIGWDLLDLPPLFTQSYTMWYNSSYSERLFPLHSFDLPSSVYAMGDGLVSTPPPPQLKTYDAISKPD